MSDPTQFERCGKSYVGYAVAMRTPGGHEIIILFPSMDAALLVGQNYCMVDPALVKRAALGPMSRPARRVIDGNEMDGGVA